MKLPGRIAVALAVIASALAAIPGTGRAQQTEPEGRIALVIGNGAYQRLPRLPNPPNDAELIATTLKRLGFTLIGDKELTDLDYAGFENAIREFGGKLTAGSVGVFYYAGHGLQIGGINYLVPTGADPAMAAANVDSQLISAGRVLDRMGLAKSKLNLVMLDACREDPFGGSGPAEVGTGLKQMDAPRGTVISYATQPDKTASDGGGGHSPYTLALADAMQQPDVPIFDMFNRVGLAVDKATNGQQLPWLGSSPVDASVAGFTFLPTLKEGLRYYEIWPQNFLQDQANGPDGKVTVEAAMIHIVGCVGLGLPAGVMLPPEKQWFFNTRIFVYQYAHRLGFRAIHPPDWGKPLGGHDYATFAEAATAGCTAMAAALPK